MHFFLSSGLYLRKIIIVWLNVFSNEISSALLPITFCRFAMGGIFTTELYAEHKTFGYH